MRPTTSMRALMYISGARTSEARRTLAVLLATVGIVAGVLAACGGGTALPPAATAQPTETRATTTVQPSATAAPPVALARVPSTATRAIAVADDTPRRRTGSFFPIGVFEDANLLDGDTARFETMIGDLQSHGLDTIMFTNNAADRDAPLLAVSDRLDFGVFMLPA